MTLRLLLLVAFDSDCSDVDLAIEELTRRGYMVQEDPDVAGVIEAVIAGHLDDVKVADAVWREVGDIANRYDGCLVEICNIDERYIPFDRTTLLFQG